MTSQVDYRSGEGRTRLVRALGRGAAQQYLHLMSTYQPQSEPAYCALTSLAVALNALGADPSKVGEPNKSLKIRSSLPQRCHLVLTSDGPIPQIFSPPLATRRSRKVWKMGWRWFSEANLDFCPVRGACQTIGLEEGRGLNIFDLRCVARRNGEAPAQKRTKQGGGYLLR